jgi:hypothetical protein
VLNLEAGWQPGASLNKPRYRATAIALEEAVYVIGGLDVARNMEVLLIDKHEWDEAPELPINMGDGTCTVKITTSQFLAISGRNVREFDESLAGPISANSWRPQSTWLDLTISRNYQACALINGLVVVAGGSPLNTIVGTTEILNIASKTTSPGPVMKQARQNFQLAVLPMPGGEARLLALGGEQYDDKWIYLDSVEEWLPGLGQGWQSATPRLHEKKSSFGAIVIDKELVCNPAGMVDKRLAPRNLTI